MDCLYDGISVTILGLCEGRRIEFAASLAGFLPLKAPASLLAYAVEVVLAQNLTVCFAVNGTISASSVLGKPQCSSLPKSSCVFFGSALLLNLSAEDSSTLLVVFGPLQKVLIRLAGMS